MLPAAPVTATRIGDLAMRHLLGSRCGGCVAHGPAPRNAAAQQKARIVHRPSPWLSGAMFEIDPAFLTSSEPLGDLALSHVRLQADARFPWLILIPRVAGARELEDLAAGERDVLMAEVLRAGA